MNQDEAGFRYLYRKTPRTGRFGPHARLMEARKVGESAELQIYNYNPYDQRDLLAVHSSGATFHINLYPFHTASATLVTACCFADCYYAPQETLEQLAHGEKPSVADTTLDQASNMLFHRTWEIELMELETTSGSYVCANCYEPIPGPTAANFALTRHSSYQQENTRRGICSWLEIHGGGLLDSEVSASLAWEAWENMVAQMKLYVAQTPPRTFAYAHAVLAAYETLSDETGPLTPPITPEQLFEDCICCRGNLKVHLTRKITVL